MIYLILKSYLTLLVAVGSAALALFATGLYFIIKFTYRTPAATPVNETTEEKINDVPKTEPKVFPPLHAVKSEEAATPETMDDVSAIAGDDVLITQLDLARAYIETGRKPQARNILQYVLEQGSLGQQQEAQRLLQLV